MRRFAGAGAFGVNSINFARVVAQMVYYFTAAAVLRRAGRKVSFTVPTGNFGDVLAGHMARRMGLPIEKLVVATNSQRHSGARLELGRYEVRGVQATQSPSMDIQVSSNFERLLFDAVGRDAAVDLRADGEPRAIRGVRHSRTGAGGDQARIFRGQRQRGRHRGGNRADLCASANISWTRTRRSR